MVTALIIPKPILEGIRLDGQFEAKRGREATGMLSGYVTDDVYPIVVSRRYPFNSQTGQDDLEGTIRDYVSKVLYIPKAARNIMQLITATNSLFRSGATPAELIYQTHPNMQSWSAMDLRLIRSYQQVYAYYGIAFAALLYVADRDTFVAMDGFRKNLIIQEKK